MPTYEYRCLACLKRFTRFYSYAEFDTAVPSCTHCGSTQVQRKIGRIRVARSDDSRAGQYDDTPMGGMENDPQGMARMMRKMSAETGQEMPAEFDEVVGRLEKGEKPEDIERAMPDLGSGMGDLGE